MKIVKLIAVSTLAATVALVTVASASEQAKPSSEVGGAVSETTPMMGAPQGGMMMPPRMQMMQNRMAMQQRHMQTMETHLANIEALLRQLVELQKQK
jgi:negative regulator of sigma E activity